MKGAAAVCVVALLLLAGLTARVVRRPSPVHMIVSGAEIAAEDARLKQMGLDLHGESFLKQYPFQAPWTSHSLLIPSTWADPGVKRLFRPRGVRADLLAADLDVLEPVMARAYGGWDSAAARGWDWNGWFADWQKQLAAHGAAEVSLDEAFAPMDRLLAFQRDNHTQIPLDRITSDGSQTALLSHGPGMACTELRASGRVFPLDARDAGQHVRTAQMWTAGAKSFAAASYISAPRSYGALQAIHCGADWIAVEPAGVAREGRASLAGQLWAAFRGGDHPKIERLRDGVVYARLPTFDASHYERVSGTAWPKRDAGDRVLIVDLRDNGGGSAEYGFDALKGWVDERRTVSFDSVGAQIASSCLYSALRWNYPGAASRQFRQQLLNRMAQSYPAGCPRTVDTTAPKWTYLQHRFQPKTGDLRIVALVNANCASDCELMVEKLASLRETLIAGVNSYGVTQMIQPGYSVLPHTGLRYRMALGRSDPYGDNRSVEGYGLDVDVVVPEIDHLSRAQMMQLAAVVAGL